MSASWWMKGTTELTPKSNAAKSIGIGKSCATCRHSWTPEKDTLCRRYPPVLRVDMRSSYVPVKPEWVCGEFSAQERRV